MHRRATGVPVDGRRRNDPRGGDHQRGERRCGRQPAPASTSVSRWRYEGTDITTSATFAAARVDRTVVVVAAGGSGSAASSLDAVAELAAMVDTYG